MKNVTDHEIKIVARDPDAYRVTVSDDHGGTVGPPAHAGISILKNTGIATLAPRSSFTEELKIDELADLSKPGTYFVRITRPLSKELGGQTVVSNVAKVIIDPRNK